MILRRVFGVLVLSLPALAQYAGPAILSRDEAPAAMEAPQVSFRPYFDVNAVYDTGLAGVFVTDAQGDLANAASTGVAVAGGVSGSHNWKHTKLGSITTARFTTTSSRPTTTAAITRCC